MRFWNNRIPRGKRTKHASCGWIIGTLAGIAFLAAGGITGQFTSIWQKAVMICLECIGIG